MKLKTAAHNIEYGMEYYLIFSARWLLVPGYLMLVLCLAVLAYKSCEEFYQLILGLRLFQESNAIAQVLVVLEMVLSMNLVLMCLFVGYTNFVSHIDAEETDKDWPRWIGRVDYSGLKIYVLGSIVIISGVKLLQAFLDASTSTTVDQTRLLWLTVIHLAFVASILVLAIAERVKPSGDEVEAKHRTKSINA